MRASTAFTPEGQRFAIGERVRVKEPLPESMRHFQTGTARIEGSYAQLYHQVGQQFLNDYSLLFDDGNTSSWYPDDVLEPVLP